MNEKTLYFSSLCPDTAPFKAAMERLGVTAREVDITASMRNLKEFLRLRGLDRPQRRCRLGPHAPVGPRRPERCGCRRARGRGTDRRSRLLAWCH